MGTGIRARVDLDHEEGDEKKAPSDSAFRGRSTWHAP